MPGVRFPDDAILVPYNSNVTNTVGQVGGDIEGDIDIAILVITSQ